MLILISSMAIPVLNLSFYIIAVSLVHEFTAPSWSEVSGPLNLPREDSLWLQIGFFSPQHPGLQIQERKESAFLDPSLLFPKVTQALEDIKSPCKKCLWTSWPPVSITRLPANTPPQRSSLTWGFRCSRPYLHFNKGLIKMFSSLKCTGVEFKSRSDRLCVGLIVWVRDITPGWWGELSDDRSCPTRSGLLSLRSWSGRWLTFHWEPGRALDGGSLKAGGRSQGNSSLEAFCTLKSVIEMLSRF